MRARGRWAAAVALAVLAASTVAALSARARLDALVTAALRQAGGDGTDATIDALGLALAPPGLTFAVTLVKDPALGTAFGGRIGLSGALAVDWVGWSGIAATPVGCLAVRAEDVTVADTPLTLPDGGRLCPVDGAPLLGWSPRGVTLSGQLLVPRLDAPTRALRADALSLAMREDPTATTLDLRVDALRDARALPAVAPLALTARAERPETTAWSFSGSALSAHGALSADFTGSHDPASGLGRVELRGKPLRLGDKGAALNDLSPLLASRMTKVSGVVTARAALSWEGDALRSSGRLLIESVGGVVGPVTVVGLNGTVTLSSLWPLVIPDGQRVAMALLDVGVPLTDGVVRFGYGRDRRVDVDEAVWRWGGGTLRADPFELSPTAPKGTVTLRAQGVDIATLLALIQVDGMAATGTLSGVLPVRVESGRVRIDGAALESTGPGSLRYSPTTPPAGLSGPEGSPTALLMGALSDFRYDSLRLSIDGEAGGELRAGLAVRGTNPTFYDGYPVALNLTLSGALDRILRQSLDAYRIPDTVRERMTGFDHPGVDHKEP